MIISAKTLDNFTLPKGYHNFSFLEKSYDHIPGKIVKSVAFPVTNNSLNDDDVILTFNPPVSVNGAVRAMEKFLSQPIDEKWSKFVDESEYEKSIKELKKMKLVLGEMLGGSLFLETAKVDKNGHMTIFLGN